MPNQPTLIDCLRVSGQLRRQAEAKHAEYKKDQPLAEIETASKSAAHRLADKEIRPNLSWATLIAREPLVAAIRKHRLTHPTAAEDARSRWEAKQEQRFGCKHQDVNGVGVCMTHGSAPPKEKERSWARRRR
jgi:hypothetical protein